MNMLLDELKSRNKDISISLISLYGVENFGVRYISSVLKKHGFRTNLVFLKKWKNNDIQPPTEQEKKKLISLLKMLKPDIVGIGLGSPYFNIATEITELIRRYLRVPVIWGGIHPTVVPERCIEVADIICRGEGEQAVLELMENLSRGREINEVKNLWLRFGTTIIKNDLRPLFQNLDELPLRDFEESEKYYIEDNMLRLEDPILKSAEVRVLASRGCPYNCSYCYNSILKKIYAHNGKYHRIRSVENVLGELEVIKAKFKPLRLVKFDDDTFVFSKNWIEEFSEGYRERIGVPFTIMLNPEAIDKAMIEKLIAAGLIRIQIGVETISEAESRDVYERIPNSDKILAFSKMNKKLKLDVYYDVILDNPLADESDKKELLDFFLKLQRPFKLFLYSLTIFPKTRLAEILLEKGIISEDDIEDKAVKAFKQYRLSFYYPRPAKDIFFISLLSLTSKDFIPKGLIRWLADSRFFKKHTFLLRVFAESCNLLKVIFIAWGMFLRGEITALKMQEYAGPKKVIIQ